MAQIKFFRDVRLNRRWYVLLILVLLACDRPDEPIVLRQVKNVVVDASSEPKLKAEAILYNPNKIRMRLKRIKVDVYINGKKSARVDQKLRTVIPARDQFSVPLEVKLDMKELGFLDTVLGMIGGRKFDVQYKGSLKVSYHGLPISIPVDYKSEIRIKI